MPTEITSNSVTLKHPKGASAEILLYGATVTSWKVGGEERLFVSSKAALDGSKPVRGGIPVVFPCFGAPTHSDHSRLSQHGFARNSNWKFDKVVMDNEAGVSVKLILKPNEDIKAIYSKDFSLAYVVTLAEHQISTDIHVENTSSSDILQFQALLHNYIRAPADEVSISPLNGLSYYDKTENTQEARSAAKIESRDDVDVRKYTDSVYENGSLHYKVSWPNGGVVELKVKNFKDVVIWNPQEEGSKIGDMEPNGWKNYVCVEPGYVRGFETLQPGKTWIGQQVISVYGN